ncbi:hypothetical protein [Pseudomonas aeruginosa]|uniref:hypothetical protein n=1 Tax=Pseudomonas aeruginosa TaxID=287 RepID=UPI0019234B3A|nr:hypothetical protein [Pseudomonas aeruginosa]
MTEHVELRRLAALAHPDAEWFIARNLDHPNIDKPAASFIAAATPKTVLGLIDEVERLEEELSQCASALPGTYYMDPPDGGNVSIPEQIRRMAKDAARYRWLRERDLETISRGGVFAGMTPENIVLNLEDLDAEIDAAIEGAKQ